MIGSNQGYIYLIEYKFGDLNIIDSRKLCDSLINNLSYSNNYEEGTIYCYNFAANCQKIIVFQIGISGDESSFEFIIFFLFLIILIIYLFKKKVKINGFNFKRIFNIHNS